ncbi:unnamed protein product [Schistosoma curassoni]|nr:unnamed protein product [Schistosoma curassoni]
MEVDAASCCTPKSKGIVVEYWKSIRKFTKTIVKLKASSNTRLINADWNVRHWVTAQVDYREETKWKWMQLIVVHQKLKKVWWSIGKVSGSLPKQLSS